MKVSSVILYRALPTGLALLTQGLAQPLVVDHHAVVKVADIGQALIDRVKSFWVCIPGESHSLGYRKGCELLQIVDPRFSVQVTESGVPESATTNHLRISTATWGDVSHPTGWRYGYGEEDWYTSAQAVARTKSHLDYCHNTGPQLAAMGFGWCWDMTWQNAPGGGVDPVYLVRWAGSSEGGPEGNLRWGLDAEDTVLTGNSVCMDTYLAATQEYIDHCRANGYVTVVFFTTGPVDSVGERGYQRHLKHEHIRHYVQASADAVLFDYADILCWSDSGEERIVTWKDHGGTVRSFQAIHADNMLDLDGTYTEDGDHIGERGAVRLAKALWWMLAQLADRETQEVRLNVRHEGDKLVFSFDTVAGYRYVLESTDEVPAEEWHAAWDSVVGDCHECVLTLPVPDPERRYYRLVCSR